MFIVLMPAWVQNIPTSFLTAVFLIILYLVVNLVRNVFFSSSTPGGSNEADPEFVRDCALQVVRAGRDTYPDMLESVEDAASYCGLSSTEAEKILDEEISVLIAEQETWPQITEVDRLNAAFSDLEALGYHTGGGLVDDAVYEVSKARKADKQAKKIGGELPGYVFYRIEGVEEALSGGHPIYFWYGIPRRKTAHSNKLRVVSDLNAALQAQGLKPEWGGTLKSQLNLPIKWQVRWDESRAKGA